MENSNFTFVTEACLYSTSKRFTLRKVRKRANGINAFLNSRVAHRQSVQRNLVWIVHFHLFLERPLVQTTNVTAWNDFYNDRKVEKDEL